MWLVMSNGLRTGPGAYRGDLYRTTGTPFNLINGMTSVNLPLTPIAAEHGVPGVTRGAGPPFIRHRRALGIPLPP
jgi:hypothetical protein